MTNVGIYSIRNVVNNKVYIGSSVNIKKRINRHKNDLKSNIHSNEHLLKSFNKYGIDNFIFSIIEECNKEDLIDREIYYINFYDSLDYKKGYNLSIPVEHPVMKAREKYRNALSQSHKGKTPSNYLNMREKRWQGVKIIKDDNSYIEYSNYNEAERELGLSKGYLHSYFKSKNKVCRKYKHLKFEKVWR